LYARKSTDAATKSPTPKPPNENLSKKRKLLDQISQEDETEQGENDDVIQRQVE